MTREQILQALGTPVREIHFDQREWMIYQGFVAALKDNKLESFETSVTGGAKVAVQSDPAGAEIYLDEQLVGSTPSVLAVAPGKHAIAGQHVADPVTENPPHQPGQHRVADPVAGAVPPPWPVIVTLNGV